MKRGVLHDPPFFAALLLSLGIAYFIWTTGSGCGVVGVLDHASLVLIFVLANELLQRAPARWARSLGRLFLISLPAAFFFLDTLHFRFFFTWGDASAARQWDELLSIWSAIRGLSKPADMIFYCALPFAAWVLLRRQNRPAVSVPVVLLLLVGSSAAHAFLASPELLYSENDPLMYALRRQARAWRKPAALPAGAGREYQLIDSSLYESAGRDDFPLMKEPLRDGKALPFQLDKQPNVVLVLMESVRAYESGAYGASPSLQPNLDRLAREGVLFKNFYANSYQTPRAEFAINASYLTAVQGSPEFIARPFVSLTSWPALLKRHGYGTLWIGSYTPDYQNKRQFLSRHGIDSFFWDVPKGYRKVGWGPSDENLFDYALNVLSARRAPYFAEIMTLSDHYPWDDPMPTAAATPEVHGEAMYRKYAAGIFYTDYAVGKFMERVRASRAFDNTLFIFCGDHGIWLFPDSVPASAVLRQEAYFRVPLILWSKRLKPRVVRAVGSQIDIGPTVLDLLGVRERNTLQGTSLFRKDVPVRYVLMSQDGRWNMRRGNVYTYDVGPEVFKDHYPFDEDAYRRLVKNKRMQHVDFAADEDILRKTDPRRFELLPDPDQARRLHRFAEGAFAYYEGLLADGRISPQDAGPASAAAQAGIDWVSIPGGSFMMGDELAGPRHRVAVKGFQMARTLVTNKQYKACVDDGACTAPSDCGGFAGDDRPVVCVDWKQASTFSQWVGGRLPSEAQWEYAARSAGKPQKYPWGDAAAACSLADVAGCGGATAPVCSKPRGNTAQGLCDMAGNAGEWTQDWYRPSYAGAPADGGAWDGEMGAGRVWRGGSWNSGSQIAQGAFRSFFVPDFRANFLGFRPAR